MVVGRVVPPAQLRRGRGFLSHMTASNAEEPIHSPVGEQKLSYYPSGSRLNDLLAQAYAGPGVGIRTFPFVTASSWEC